jgi:Ca2+:H+ antiporter
VLNFLKDEKSLLISVISIFIAELFVKHEAVRQSDILTAVMFLFVFIVILNAAFSVVRHAEVLAYIFGEPYGTMILTFSAVTVEVIMVAAMMLHADEDPTLARDTIFATIMILLNGLIGIVMLVGGLKYGEQKYNLKSSNSFFSMILGLVGLGMFIPNLISPGFYFTFEIFLIITSLLLYAFFIRMQSREQSYHFTFANVPQSERLAVGQKNSHESGQGAAYHILFLLLTIVSISVLAEYLSITIDDGIAKLNLPDALAAIIVSIIIISPEGLTAIRAGLNNDMQRVINISLGSVLSTISLTIPAVLLVGLITSKNVVLGLSPVQSGLVIISLLVGMLSCKEGETNALQGFIHVILFVTFIFLIFL